MYPWLFPGRDKRLFTILLREREHGSLGKKNLFFSACFIYLFFCTKINNIIKAEANIITRSTILGFTIIDGESFEIRSQVRLRVRRKKRIQFDVSRKQIGTDAVPRSIQFCFESN